MTTEQTKLVQIALEFLGFNPGKADGIWGPKTQAAYLRYVESLQSIFEIFDDRTEKNLASLLPQAEVVARKFIKSLKLIGIDARIISGTRSYSEQDALYNKGRTQPGPKVTNARGGDSNHNFGIAFDLGIFEQGKYLEESSLYKEAGAIGEKLGLSWGGRWDNFTDEPHYELKPLWADNLSESQMLAELRNRTKNKMKIYG